jgi:hypothetical protein
MPRRSSNPIVSTPQKTNVPAIVVPKPSFLQTIKDGFAFGTGSAVAHRVVGSIFGSPAHTQVQPEGQVNEKRNIEYEQCMKDYNNRDVCEIYLGK